MTKQWTILEALDWTEQRFAKQGEENPRLMAQLLTAHATGLSRIELYAYFDKPLSEAERTVLRESIARRLEGEPAQYIIGTVGFRYLELKVHPPVLIPRPETELLVELVVQHVAELPKQEQSILDIGTGTGAIALSLLHELSGCRVLAIDIDAAALALAQENARALELDDSARLQILQDDLASSLIGEPKQQGSFDVVVSNPPYIPTHEYQQLPAEIARFESALALDGGADGLAVFERIVPQAEILLKAGGLLAVELHENTLEKAAALVSELAFSAVQVHADLTGRNRFLTAVRR